MEMSVEGMGTLMKQKFDGNNGYMEQMGQKIPMKMISLKAKEVKKDCLMSFTWTPIQWKL